MSTLVGAELLKLRTTRAWIGYLLALVVLSGIAAAGQVGSAHDFQLETRSFQRDLMSSAATAGLIALLVGITCVTVEWRHGTITRTLLVTPRREHVLVAKGVSSLLVGAMLAVVALAVVLAVAVPWMSIDGASLDTSGLSGVVGRLVLAAALWGALGAAVGAVVQSQTVALIGAIVWVVIMEALVSALLELIGAGGVSDYLPARSLRALESTDTTGLSPAAGAAVGLVYIGVIGVLGVVRVRRRDIT